VLKDGQVHEAVKGKLYHLDANVYIHHFSCDLVGYQSENGAYKVIESDRLLGIVPVEHPDKGLMRCDLYQDIGGEYFPLLDTPDTCYYVRGDGKVEAVTTYNDSSAGRVIENVRGRIRIHP
jgi:hypothetical protein